MLLRLVMCGWLASIAGCYASHEREDDHEPCGGVPEPSWTDRGLTRPSADTVVLEVVGERVGLDIPVTIAGPGALDLTWSDGHFVLAVSGEPAHVAVLGPDGRVLGDVAGHSGAANVALDVAGDRIGVALGRSGPTTPGGRFVIGDASGAGTDAWDPPDGDALDVVAAGPGDCWAVATLDRDRAMDLTFLDGGAAPLAPTLRLDDRTESEPLLVTHGSRMFALWIDNRIGEGNVLVARAFEAGVPLGVATVLDDRLVSPPFLAATAIRDRVAVLGLDAGSARPFLQILDPRDTRRTAAGLVAARGMLQDLDLAALPDEGVVAACWRREEIEVQLVGLDAVPWGQPLEVAPSGFNVACAWSGEELLVAWLEPAPGPGFLAVATQRVRLVEP